MAYVVLARKYRPMRFADMVGQEHIARTLGNAITSGRVHHAYLFAGARGLGKTTTARIFAKGLVCERGPTPEPCNECTQCVAVNDGSSVDVIEIDGASNNSVDNIRNLREQVHYLPQSARRKVYIIDEVHMLTTSAFNALLKTLEEPPEHVNFVFATTEPQKVLPTILSRVNRLDFRRVSVAALAQHLEKILLAEGLGMVPEGLRLVARAATGSVRDALTLLDQVVAFAEDPMRITEDEARRLLGLAGLGGVVGLVDAILEHDAAATLRAFDALVAEGHDLGVLAMQVLEHFRDLAVLKVAGPEVLVDSSEAELGALRRQVENTDLATIGQMFDRFSRVLDRLPTSRAQRLLLEMGLLDLAASEPMVPINEIVDRLEYLAGGGTPTGSGGSAAGGRGRPTAAPRSRAGGREASGQAGETGFAAPVREAVPTVQAAPVREAAPTAQAAPPRETAPLREAAPPQAVPTPQAAPPQAVPTPQAVPLREAAPTGRAGDSGPPSVAEMREVDAQSTGDLPHEEPTALTFDPPEGLRVSVPAPSPAHVASPPAALAFDPPAPAPSSAFAQNLWSLAEGALARPGDEAAERVVPSAPAEPPRSETREADDACGPCRPDAAPRPDVISIDGSEWFAAWEELVARVREEDEGLSAVLGLVGVASMAEGLLRLVAPRGAFESTRLAQPSQRARLVQALRDHFGVAFEVVLEEGAPALPDRPSVVLVHEDRRRRHRAAIDEEVRSEPRIANLLSTFSATIKATRPTRDA